MKDLFNKIEDSIPEFEKPVLLLVKEGKNYDLIIGRLESIYQCKDRVTYNWKEGEHSYDDLHYDYEVKSWVYLSDIIKNIPHD